VIVALHRNTVPNRLPDLPEVIDEKHRAALVLRVGDSVFRDVDRFAVAGGLAEQVIEPLRVNLTVAEVADLGASRQRMLREQSAGTREIEGHGEALVILHSYEVRCVLKLPTNFRVYVSNVYLPQRRKKWKDSTDQTTTERIGTHLLPAFESFELGDLTRIDYRGFSTTRRGRCREAL